MTSTQEQAQEAAGQAKDKASEAARQARGRAREQVDQRSTQAGERVSAQASDVRSVADALRDQGQDQPAKLADQAADRAERLGGYLQDADADRILSDLEDLGRRQPMTVLLGGLALGFAASRFVKASSQERYAAAQSASPPRSAYATTPALPTAPAGGAMPGAVPGAHPGVATPPPGFAPIPGVAPAPSVDVDPTFPEPVVGDERREPLAPRPPTVGGL